MSLQNHNEKKSTALSTTDATPRPTTGTRSRNVVHPLRTVAILGAVGALVTAIALPAFASTHGGPAVSAKVTNERIAADNAQSIVVASEATQAPSSRGTFSATTPDEIEQRKAEEAAAARAAQAAAKTASVRSTAGYALVAPGSGAVRYPLIPGSFRGGEGPGSGRGHQGWDMLAPEGTPIYAAAAGTVRVSTEGYYGYGVAIVIDHVINGTPVSTLYGHMVYGSRLVESGQQVSAGQLIGQVGNTGNSYGSHLHFEVHIGGGIVDPEPWLAANAG
ncbi:M23 family metallopeptidase [Microbacterium capsulatum]|uniref:M23 family metallopeptidase n=1 Tax=Microbacterium capsulatum TaxID=3041921 RepID=A0ABU0XI29_9MICO|nr:M23 family metallopeptidase [Microbacterium sp. ASV81]MDQ4213795.1 M23 family metallopeptidase [Microbacterium sp. ASV81]